MRFGEAIDEVTKRPGVMMYRLSNADRLIGFQTPSEKSDMNGAYFYARYPDDIKIPWSPCGFDMCANDWKLYEE